MKALIVVDLVTIKRHLPNLGAISLLFAGLAAFASGEISSFTPVFSLAVTIYIAFAFATYDEKNGWEAYRLTYPVSRRHVVAGRYITIVLLSILASVTALLLCAVAGLLSPSSGFDLQAVIVSGLFATAAALIILSLLLPAIVRFGLMKARLVLLVACVLPAALVALFPDLFQSAFSTSASTAASPLGLWVLVGAILLAATAIYMVSCGISVALYNRKEF